MFFDLALLHEAGTIDWIVFIGCCWVFSHRVWWKFSLIKVGRWGSFIFSGFSSFSSLQPEKIVLIVLHWTITHSELSWQIISSSCLGQETAKEPFSLQVKLPPAHLFTTHGGGFTLSFFNELQAGKMWIPIFYSLWFDLTGNRTWVYHFCNRHFIRLTTSSLNSERDTSQPYCLTKRLVYCDLQNQNSNFSIYSRAIFQCIYEMSFAWRISQIQSCFF